MTIIVRIMMMMYDGEEEEERGGQYSHLCFDHKFKKKTYGRPTFSSNMASALHNNIRQSLI